MKLSISVRTAESRGDHDADVLIAFDAQPGETVEQLVERVNERRVFTDTDVIEIRRCYEPPPPPPASSSDDDMPW